MSGDIFGSYKWATGELLLVFQHREMLLNIPQYKAQLPHNKEVSGPKCQ
jgi:hypothetical protein